MTELPRGWIATNQPAAGIGPSITIPASPGIAHVITAMDALAWLAAAAIVPYIAGVTFSCSSGLVASFNLGIIVIESAPDSGSASFTGLLQAPIGDSINVQFPSEANANGWLQIQGYDI